MKEYLPGNLQERLRELREANGYGTRQELADKLGIDKSTYGRMESGATKTVSSDILIKLSELYNVTTDYILGISDVPERTYYDIGELGLSVKAAGNLYSKNADPRVINELLVNEKFQLATRQMALYFSDVFSAVLRSNNNLYDFCHDLLTDCTNAGRLPKDKEMNNLKKRLRASKVQSEPYQINKIQVHLMAAVREIKKKVTDEMSTDFNKVYSAEVLEAVKADFLAHGDLNDISYEEKKGYVISAVKAGIRCNTELTEEDLEQHDKAIDIIMPTMMDLFKTK